MNSSDEKQNIAPLTAQLADIPETIPNKTTVAAERRTKGGKRRARLSAVVSNLSERKKKKSRKKKFSYPLPAS